MDLPSTFNFKGWNIRYNLTGRNPQSEAKCVVFVHGTPWSSAVFRPTIETLLSKQSYKILVYDLPGYGQSQDLDTSTTNTVAGFQGDTSVKFQAEALAALLKHTGLNGGENPSPAVIAHDIAGTIVLRARLLHGCDFDTMMMLETNTVLPWGDGFYKLCRSEPKTFVKLPPAIFEAVVRAVVRSACHDPKVLITGWEDILTEPWIGTTERQESFVRQIAQANDGDVQEMLDGEMYGRVRCDVKILWGEQDQWIPREKVEDLGKRLGGRCKEFVVVPEAGHLVMLDQPGRVAVEIFDWLTRFGSESSFTRA